MQFMHYTGALWSDKSHTAKALWTHRDTGYYFWTNLLTQPKWKPHINSITKIKTPGLTTCFVNTGAYNWTLLHSINKYASYLPYLYLVAQIKVLKKSYRVARWKAIFVYF